MNYIKNSSFRGLGAYVLSDLSGTERCDLGGIKRSDAVVTSERRKHTIAESIKKIAFSKKQISLITRCLQMQLQKIQ